MKIIFTQRGEYGGRWYDPGSVVAVPDDFVLGPHMNKIDEATGEEIPTPQPPAPQVPTLQG